MSSKTIKCGSCSVLNSDQSRFCTQCGTKMPPPALTSAGSSKFLAPVLKPAPTGTSTQSGTLKPVTSTTLTTTASRPSSTIVKSTTSTSTASSGAKPPTTTTSVSSFLKPSTTTTTTAAAGLKKPDTPSTTGTLNRPKSHTVSYKPTTNTLHKTTSSGPLPSTTTTAPTSEPSWKPTGSFVKMAAKSRETLDAQATRDSMVLQGAPITTTAVSSSKPPVVTNTAHKKTISTPGVSKPPTTTTTTTTNTPKSPPPPTPNRPPSMSVSHSPSSRPPSTFVSSPSSPSRPSSTVVSKSSTQHSYEEKKEEMEKQIQQEKERLHQKEKEIEKQRQAQLEKDKEDQRLKLQQEREKQLEKERLEKEKQQEKERLEKEKHDKKEQSEREKIEKEKQKQAEKEKQKQMEKEKELERERQKQADKEKIEKEKQRLLEEKQKIAEDKQRLQEERDKQKQLLEKEKLQEKERQKQLLREKNMSNSPKDESFLSSFISTRKDSISLSRSSSPATVQPSHPLNGSFDNGGSNNDNSMDHSNDSDDENRPVSPISFSDIMNGSKHSGDESSGTSTTMKRKKDKEKYSTRLLSFIRGNEKDREGEDDFVISSPSSPSPLINSSADSLDTANQSGEEDGPQLRKWAIKREELRKSEKDLFAYSPSSPNNSSSNSVTNGGTMSALSLNGGNGSNPTPPMSPTIGFVPSVSSPGEGRVMLGGSRISSPNPPPDYPTLPASTEQRDRVIQEIICTEADYIRDLEIMVWLKKELSAQDDIKVSGIEEINSLFSNVEQLLMVNRELYRKFCNTDQSVKTDDFADYIANGFFSMADFLKSYFVYCSNQQKALSTFSNMKGKNCTYLAYLLTRRECRSLPFDSFLIKPVQRVCKYPLLLRELIKSTPNTTETYKSLTAAQTKIEGIVLTVNEKKREFDSQMKMYDIQTRLVESGDNTKILSPSRKFVKEGVMESWGHIAPTQGTQYNKKPKEGQFYLFNDLFIFAQVKSSGANLISSVMPIKVKANLLLGQSLIREVPNDPLSFEIVYIPKDNNTADHHHSSGANSTNSNDPDQESNQHEHVILNPQNSTIWMFSMSTPEEKNAIFSEIGALIESILKNEYRKFIEDRQKEKAAAASVSPPSSGPSLNVSSSALSSTSSSSEIEFDEWRKLVKNKPLPAPPVPNAGSPSVTRLSKALPPPPVPPPPSTQTISTS
ncbi:hypothetical protein CYY_000080 [Polysphondylium violaceum]|uniref:DH domain-containing protein n=1 Tax=Polysphondylium violaceum TaxID=133409 RepID=A0A8J4Q4E2_9MYCE|nr:hypothetical protein CYY_000080 [Polysphondylium violaceum]